MPRLIDDFARPYQRWLFEHSDLHPTTIYVYTSCLRWLCEYMGTHEPTEVQLEQGLKAVADQVSYRFTPTRRSWNLYVSYREHTDGKKLPEAKYILKRKDGKSHIGGLPETIQEIVRRMMHELDIPRHRLGSSLWLNVDWNEFDDPDWGRCVYLISKKGADPRASQRKFDVWSPVPVAWMKELKEWAQPKRDTDPLIPLFPGSSKHYPYRKY